MGPVPLQDHPLLKANRPTRVRPRDPARYAHTLYQKDFEECLAKRGALRKAIKEVKKIEKYIATAMRSGARVEPGSLTPELLKVNRKAYKVGSGSYYRLEIRR